MKITYEEIVDYLYGIPKFTAKNSLEHTAEMLRRLDIKEEQFQIVHVAGSNGKGSVCNAINRIFLRGGKRTGMFTSPHLICMEERFCINGQNCSREDFVEAFVCVMQVVEEMQQEGLAHPTFFEYLFAMGMWIFQKHHVEYLVMETGLGGRLDCTNVIRHPLITVITSISLEHTQYLGDTIEQIAWEKAGIIKTGVPVVCDASDPNASTIIEEMARSKGCDFYQIKSESLRIHEFTQKNIDFCLDTDYYENTRIIIPFGGKYQVMNMSLVYLTMKVIASQTGIDDSVITDVLRSVRWTGRMQQVAEGIYLEGAHNVAGIHSFAETLQLLQPKHPILLFSMVQDKDYENSIKELARAVEWDRVIVTEIQDERGIRVRQLQHAFERYGCKVIVRANCREAYAHALAIRQKGQQIYCTGSLYFVGELLAMIGGNEND